MFLEILNENRESFIFEGNITLVFIEKPKIETHLIIKSDDISPDVDKYSMNISAPMPSLVYYYLQVLRSDGNTVNKKLSEVK